MQNIFLANFWFSYLCCDVTVTLRGEGSVYVA